MNKRNFHLAQTALALGSSLYCITHGFNVSAGWLLAATVVLLVNTPDE